MNAIQSLVDRFARDLEAAIRADIYASIQASLSGHAPAAPRAATPASPAPAVKRGPGRPPKSETAHKISAPSKARRSAADIESDASRIIVAVKAKPGSTAEQLKSATKIPSADFPLPIKKLLEERRIRKSGEKRSTKYFPA